MQALEYLKDKDFLRALDNEGNKFYWVKVEVLDKAEEPIASIEGRVQPGSAISINGDSAVRRTCNITFIAEEDADNNLDDVESLFSMNNKIRIYEGIKNNINTHYDDIIWFPLGVYVITQPSISHNSGGCIINLSCKDKMCLLNGECGGGLPTSVTFDSYDQIIGLVDCGAQDPAAAISEPNNYTIYSFVSQGETKYKSWTAEFGWIDEEDASSVGEKISVPQRFYDIIQTLVCNFGGESLDKIFINDIPLDIKQSVRYTGSNTLYFNTSTGYYSTDATEIPAAVRREFEFNDDIGYIYTDFTYPGSLVSGIGENVCSVLDKVKAALGNYEYFYDVNGNFVFQEVKNYLNTSYSPLDGCRLDDYYKIDSKGQRIIEIASNGLSILDNVNYKVDFYGNTRSVYTFNQGNGLIISAVNNPDYTNVKNDFHIWGEDAEGYAIHYHLAVKNKPEVMNTYSVIYLKDGEEYTGGIRLANESEIGKDYTPEDWRAEMYLQGLEKQQKQIRPDIYEQELLDLFDMIYNFKEKRFKSETVECPNDLKYFFDFIEPDEKTYQYTVDILKPKVYSYQEDKIRRLYNTDIPNLIMISTGRDPASRAKLIDRCASEGQPYSNVDDSIYSNTTIGTIGYTAQEVARDLLYQYTNYNENISLQSIPIYYLDVNTRITVNDRNSGIYGDYIIKSISLPLSAEGTMSISAVKALERV